MAEKQYFTKFNNIKINASAYDNTCVTPLEHFNIKEVKNVTNTVQPILERWHKIPTPELPRFLKASNPYKSLAYWQGRKTEIAQIHQWLADQNTCLIGIQGVGGTGKSMLAAKIYAEINGFSKRFWGDVSYGAGFIDLARQKQTATVKQPPYSV
jgi:hypothetical protein